jgi:hypothetical protein
MLMLMLVNITSMVVVSMICSIYRRTVVMLISTMMLGEKS